MKPKLTQKRWTIEAEKEISAEWKDTEPYSFNPKSDKPLYSIDTPPPYLNTPIHIGHATTYSLMDMFARYKRMSGYNVLFPLGLDKNGLPIEMAAEKKFGIKFNKMPREEFLGKCKRVLDEAGLESLRSFVSLGIGFNSWKPGTGIGDAYETDSPDYRALTQETFIDLWEKGLIYEQERINNYCPGCRTTIADAEIEHVESSTQFAEVKFKVKETGEDIVIATTRPELIASDRAVIFNPEDKRYKHLEGKTAVTPLYNREVPIFAHPMASPDTGTGLVMMSTAGDTADIRFCREMGLSTVISISKDGTMNDNAKFLSGMLVADARKRMITELEKNGLLVKLTPTTHKTPVCDRSGDHVEFISMKEFYLKQVDVKEDMIKLAEKAKFYDDSSRQMLVRWIEGISMDWPISRRRYYATEIPLWKCKKCGSYSVPPKGRYYQPWKEPCPVEKCSCGSADFEGETRVLDTWFDSGNSPLYIHKYNRDPEFFRKSFPCTLRPQGKDIIRTWLYYTMLKVYLLTGMSAFDSVWINYYVVDEHGKKMSKRTGNVVDPQKILAKYGAESFRFWIAVEGNITTSDFRCSFQRIEGAGKSIVKLWNVARFVSMFETGEEKAELQPLDVWIRHEANEIVKACAESYAGYDFHSPALKVKHFIWETFASHYLELVKNRAYNSDGKFTKSQQQAAVETLYYCLDRLLLVLAPIVPMVTYSIYKKLYGKDVHQEKFPGVEDYKLQGFSGAELEELNRAIWKQRTEKGLSLKAGIKQAVIPEKFKPIESDLMTAHSIAEISYGEKLNLTFETLTEEAP